MLFQMNELANKAEITILLAQDKTRAWVLGQGIMGRDVGVYRTGCNTWLSSRLQNHPCSFVLFYLFFFCLVLYVLCIQSGRIGCSNFIFVKPSQDGLLNCLELEPQFLPRLLAHFSPTGVFSGRFFLASVLAAFAMLAVSSALLANTSVCFLPVFLCLRFILYFISIVRSPA